MVKKTHRKKTPTCADAKVGAFVCGVKSVGGGNWRIFTGFGTI